MYNRVAIFNLSTDTLKFLYEQMRDVFFFACSNYDIINSRYFTRLIRDMLEEQ